MLNQALGSSAGGGIVDAFGNHMHMAGSTEEFGTLDDLRAAMVDDCVLRFRMRATWHGYQVVLRPLLVFFDYRALRFLNAIVFIAFLRAAAVILRFRLGLEGLTRISWWRCSPPEQ